MSADTFAKLKVIGVGGSGGSAINRMMEAKIRGVDFIAINTDVQALHHNTAPTKFHIGKNTTRGLGAGMNPELGRKAAEESQNEIRELLKGADMVFITCGLGGGTGSGASPVVAGIAKEMGALTVAVVTKPFSFEGAQRRVVAERALDELTKHVDTIIIIPNDRLLQISDPKTSLLQAFSLADDVLKNGVEGIAELITVPGLINVDFADVRAVMSETGTALMGIGRKAGENRAVEAARAAITSPLLDVAIDGAKGILFTIAGGSNLTMHEVAQAAEEITKAADLNAKIIFGAIIDEALKDDIKITVVATGFERKISAGSGQRLINVEHPKDKIFKKLEVAVSNSNQTESSDDKVSFFKHLLHNEDKPKEEEPVIITPLPATVKPVIVAPEPARSFEPSARLTPRQPTRMEPEDELEIPAFIRKKTG